MRGEGREGGEKGEREGERARGCGWRCDRFLWYWVAGGGGTLSGRLIGGAFRKRGVRVVGDGD